MVGGDEARMKTKEWWPSGGGNGVRACMKGEVGLMVRGWWRDREVRKLTVLKWPACSRRGGFASRAARRTDVLDRAGRGQRFNRLAWDVAASDTAVI